VESLYKVYAQPLMLVPLLIGLSAGMEKFVVYPFRLMSRIVKAYCEMRSCWVQSRNQYLNSVRMPLRRSVICDSQWNSS
jgi:hypothetical protein